jgi:hypothetical protein
MRRLVLCRDKYDPISMSGCEWVQRRGWLVYLAEQLGLSSLLVLLYLFLGRS